MNLGEAVELAHAWACERDDDVGHVCALLLIEICRLDDSDICPDRCEVFCSSFGCPTGA